MATFTISINGWGAEMCLGRITPAAYEYWSTREDDDPALSSHLFWDPYSDEDGNEITDDEDPRWIGQWWECDDIEHCHGAFKDQCHIVVTDEDDNQVWSTEDVNIHKTEFSSPDDIRLPDPDIDPDVDLERPPSIYFIKTWNSEKGNFFSAEFETDNFDPAKLKFFATEIDGDTVIDHVTYDDQDLENDGGDTRGKSSGWEFYEVFY